MAATIRALRFDPSGLQAGAHFSANAKGQRRGDNAVTGHKDVAGNLVTLWPILRIAERAHVGRKAVEGFGAIRLHPV